jgi:pimeloyl-ACP methyl ester carboxylesterase
LNVLIARRLAAERFRCLRVDLSGFGDSRLEVDVDVNDVYPATAFRDVDLVMKQVEQRLGAKRVVLMGLSSGAYAAFQSAAQIPNRSLVESVLINPLRFYWNATKSPSDSLFPFDFYRSVAFEKTRWLKLISGRSRIGVMGAIKVLGANFRLWKLFGGCKDYSVTEAEKNGTFSHPLRDDLPGDLKKIVGLNRNLAMFFSRSDPGFHVLNYHAKRTADELQAAGKLKISFIEDADHTFSRRAAREDLIQAVAAHLRDRYPI